MRSVSTPPTSPPRISDIRGAVTSSGPIGRTVAKRPAPAVSRRNHPGELTDTVKAQMPGFLLRPKWIAFHLLVVGAVVLMINLGFWQLGRLDERRADNASYAERVEQEPVSLVSILDDPAFEPQLVENRRVTASGTYLPDQVVLFNRSQAGRAVDNVLTPLALDDGGIVLVNRGAIPVQADPPAPPGPGVAIVGRLRSSEARTTGGLTNSTDGRVTEVRRVDLDLLRPQIGDDLAPMYVELIAGEPGPGPSDPVPLETPTLGEGNHLSYAFQWFIFAICVFIGWVLAVRRSLAGHRRVSEDGSDGRTPPGSPQPTAAESATTRS